MQLTGIASGHGQAFDGFLHLSEFTYTSESPGASELFRAHETAHQWWGHEVGWESYRDQWLSESLAEYSAMMYVETSLKNGAGEMIDILRAYTQVVKGSLKGMVGKYSRPWLVDLDLSHRKRLGPIGLGWRASTAEMPGGYQVQVYHKGPLVVHMLRKALAYYGQGDELFVRTLREFVKEHRGGAATTADLLATVNRVSGRDWTWFFDQWIDGTAIPTYTWSYEVGAPGAGGKVPLTIQVKQEDVPEGFLMMVPVRINLGSGQTGTFVARVDKPENTFQVDLPARPLDLDFNPDFAVLATVKKR
jgi:aminopeptidase N